MEIGRLLEELIDMAQVSKTDFAISMNMTPSGLSKILTGKRLPQFREKTVFCKQAANYFAEATYCHGCYLKYKNIFPVIYDFDSKYELGMLLSYAIEYTLDKNLSEENNVNLDYPERELSFLGKKTILNMFCVILSDSIINDRTIPLEFFSTLPLSNRLYSDTLGRIKIINPKMKKNISFNHFLDFLSLEASCDDKNTDILSSIVKAQQYVDLNLWKSSKEIDSSFLLLKGQFLLLFSIQMDGTPLMVLITHKSYLTVFFNSLMKKNAKKISYNKNEAIAALEADPLLIDKLTGNHIDAVFNFISIGYLIDKKELENAACKESIKKIILKLFNDVLLKEASFFVTIDAMISIYLTGKAFVPLIGAIDIAPDERIAYLERFASYINEKSHDKFRVVNSDLPKVAILCAHDLSLVYMIDSEDGSEKIHCFQTDMINTGLTRKIEEGTMTIMDFSSDLWDTYINGLAMVTRHNELPPGEMIFPNFGGVI